MLIMRRVLPLALAGGMAVIACAAPAVQARSQTSAVSGARTSYMVPAVSVAPVAFAARSYSAPPGAWSRFQSDLTSAGGLATGQGVTIAVLSSGILRSASGLSGKVIEGPRYFGKQPEAGPHDDGTMVASMILGVPGIVQGAAPDARILDVPVLPTATAQARKFFKQDDTVKGNILAKGIRYAVSHGARVIESDDEVLADTAPALASAVADAVAKGVVIVGQGWNPDNSAHYMYPQGLPGVIGAGSVMLPGGIDPASLGGHSVGSATSARNNSMLISGPGDFVQVTQDFGAVGPGTAVPYVTAAVALIKQRYPDLPPALVERALAMSARDKPSGGYSTQAGFGILDPYDAVLDAGKLVGLATTAKAGPGVEAATAHFGTIPGPVHALPSALPQEIASVAGIVAGAALLALAMIIAIRGRKKPVDGNPAEAA